MEAGQPYLVPGLFFGLVNQQITLVNAIATAIIMNYTLVLPPYSLDWRENHRAADIVSVFKLHDEVHFASMAEQHGLTYVEQLPPQYFPYCIQQLQSRHHLEVMPLEDIRVRAERHGVVCLKSQHSIFLDKTFPAAGPPLARAFGHMRAVALINFLRPAAIWTAAVDALVAGMLARYNASRFVAVHLRIEHDWIEACFSEAWFKMQHERGMACYINEDHFCDHLTQRRNVSAGRVVYVAGSDRPSRRSKLCTTYQCVHRSDLPPVFHGSLAQYKSLTGEGYMDLLVLGRAAEFYGNPYSTFSAFAIRAVREHGGYSENIVLPPPATIQPKPVSPLPQRRLTESIRGTSQRRVGAVSRGDL